jgi:hypothetical protein
MRFPAALVPEIRLGLACLGLLAAQPGMAATLTDAEPRMQITWQLSAPAASEIERDLLRREYRLSQGSSEFWMGFDGLNARIHGAADRLRGLRGDIEGAQPDRTTVSLLSGLVAPAGQAEPPLVPLQEGLPAARTIPSEPSPEEGGAMLAWAVAVLGTLTFFLVRLRDKARRVKPAAPFLPPPLPHGKEASPLPAAPAVVEKRLDRPTEVQPEAEPPDPSLASREEMDHALDLAEVMLSYGRTTGAMQALKDYLFKQPTLSVRPWLRLLELYRQTGMGEDFERAAATVHRHFNVRVPGWDEGVAGVPLRSFFDDEEHTELLGLEQIPHILEKVQATWPGPACQEYLRHLLADNRGGERQGFPVSVVAEILLLEDILSDRLIDRN